MRCGLCPVADIEVCRGEAHWIFCAYIDPSSPKYTPAYARILVRDDVVEQPISYPPNTQQAAKNKGGCCGGSDDAMAIGPD